MLALGDVVEAIDRSRNISVSFFNGRIFTITVTREPSGRSMSTSASCAPRYSAHHFGHRALLVRHETAIRAEQLKGAAKPLVGIPSCRCAAPQFRGDAIEFLNHTGGINGIDRDGAQVEQDAVALFAFA